MLSIVIQFGSYDILNRTILLAALAYLERQKSDTWRMAKGEEKRTARFSMRLPASVYARLLKAANGDRRSMADVALIAIEAHLNALDNPSVGKH